MRGDGFAINEVAERRAADIQMATAAFYNNLTLRKGSNDRNDSDDSDDSDDGDDNDAGDNDKQGR